MQSAMGCKEIGIVNRLSISRFAKVVKLICIMINTN